MTSAGIGPGYRVAGRYRLLSRLGGGGMGAVWLATDERLGREVAIKQVVLPPGVDPAVAEEHRARTMREGRIAARVSHPHAISVYDVAEDGGQPWLVMEHLPSRSLADVLSADGVLPVQQVAQIGAQLADALVATHAAGIVHRDVKPGNVLVGQGDRLEGLVKITDFGISHAQGDVRLTQTGMLTGTPAFLSPEVARGQEPGPAGDVFSLGATLYTCLEGDPPFGSSGNSLEMLHRAAAGDVRPPQRSGALTATIERMLGTDPAARPTMAQVRDELAGLAAGRGGDVTAVLTARTPLQTVPAPPRAPTRTDLPAPPRRTAVAPAPAPRRSRGGLVAAGLVLVLLLVAGGVFLVTRPDDASTTTADPTTSAPATSAAQPVAPTEDPTTEAAPTTEATTEPTEDVVTAADVATAIEGYYALLPGDPQTAYGLTGPTLQEASSRGDYTSFWNRFDDVVLGPVSATDGSLEATGQVTFVEDGEEQVEQHRFVLVEGADGALLMDVDVIA
ncbi:protein kinase [Geodermatophilaceae bacterium NBWT11]|nr:protein kinase [Geodermatophilaceae bacterium NBWT11]